MNVNDSQEDLTKLMAKKGELKWWTYREGGDGVSTMAAEKKNQGGGQESCSKMAASKD